MTATAKELFGARDNLLEVISMKDKFFAKVSHELRTPLVNNLKIKRLRMVYPGLPVY